MVSDRKLPAAMGPGAWKKGKAQMVAAAAIITIAVVSIALLLLLASISSFSFPWGSGNQGPGQDGNSRKTLIPATEADYTGIWQGFTPDKKCHTVQFTPDNRFRHWIADNVSIQSYNGSWRYDSSLYVYRLVYDREDYSASVKIIPAAEGDVQIMHLEPLSSAPGMPLKGFDLEKVEVAPAAPEY